MICGFFFLKKILIIDKIYTEIFGEAREGFVYLGILKIKVMTIETI